MLYLLKLSHLLSRDLSEYKMYVATFKIVLLELEIIYPIKNAISFVMQ